MKRATPEESAEQANSEEASEQSEIQILRDTMQDLADERDQLKDQLLRAMADFQNFKKRQEEQWKKMQQLAAERVVLDMIPVMDNFERTLLSIERGATLESVAEGIKGVEKQMRSALEAHGVQRMQAVGEPFDPEHHDAIGIETSEDHEHDTVMEEIEPGYKMGERIVRPARVRVAKRP